MKLFGVGLLYFYLWVGLLSGGVAGDCGPWIPLDINTLPPAAPDDIVWVWQIIAPLLECSYGDAFSLLNCYHGGIGIVNNRTGFAITLNYDAYPSFMGAILPAIVTLPDGSKDLRWSNLGRVYIYAGINTTYWNTKTEAMTIVNGKTYNAYMNWIKTYNTTAPWYNIWGVFNMWPGPMLISNHQCFNFVWESLAYLNSLGAVIVPKTARFSLLAIFTNQTPLLVDYNNPATKTDILRFYQELNDQVQSYGVLAFLTILDKMAANSTFYVRANADYYKIQLTSPFVGAYYDFIATPGNIPAIADDYNPFTLTN